MSTTSRPGSCGHPTPDRVAVETPRGDVATGDVVDVRYTASAESSLQCWYIVRINGVRLRVPESEPKSVTNAP
jgi:hypothetical protein